MLTREAKKKIFRIRASVYIVDLLKTRLLGFVRTAERYFKSIAVFNECQ